MQITTYGSGEERLFRTWCCKRGLTQPGARGYPVSGVNYENLGENPGKVEGVRLWPLGFGSGQFSVVNFATTPSWLQGKQVQNAWSPVRQDQ